MPIKLFLSYPSEQLYYACEVNNFVKSVGMTLWFDKESLIGGQDWERERELAQKEADVTLLFCSTEILTRSGVIQREIKEALKRCEDVPFGQICLVPLRVAEFTPPQELNVFQRIDLFEDDWKFKLARALKIKFEQCSVEKPVSLINFIKERESNSEFELKRFVYKFADIEMEANYFHYMKDGLFWDLARPAGKRYARSQ